MNELTRLLRAPGVGNITISVSAVAQEAVRVLIDSPPNSHTIASTLAAEFNLTDYRVSDGAPDEGEVFRFYDWYGVVDGLRVLVTCNERVPVGSEPRG